MAEEIGIGLVGAGLIGGVHAAAIAAVPGARLLAVCGRDAERTREFAARHEATAYTDYDAFLAHPGLIVVDICTPSGTHAEFGIKAASAGHHVLVEKPIEITPARADALIDACEAAGVRLGAIFQSRFLPATQRIRRAAIEGRFGRLLLGSAYVKWYRAPEYYAAGSWHGTLALDGGGALINQAIHTLDLLQWVMGPAAEVCAFRGALRYSHLEGEDTLVGSLRFRSGALGAIEATTSVAPGFKRRLEISGERGTAILDGDAISHWSLDDGEERSEGNQADITDGSADPATIAIEGHRRQIEDFVAAISDGSAPEVDGREARKSIVLVDALYRAADERRVVSL
jgi:predicted dehydrogenase